MIHPHFYWYWQFAFIIECYLGVFKILKCFIARPFIYLFFIFAVYVMSFRFVVKF